MGLNSFLVLAFASAISAYEGDGDWAAAYQKANASLAKLANADKVNMVTGVGWQKGPSVGNTKAISSIGYPELCLQDSPLGVRYAQGVTAFPAGIQAAATWDTLLMYQRGAALGAEAKGLGVHVQLAPVAGPLGKNAEGGRNWEGFSPDPYLTDIAMANTIQGMQSSGVQACAKHCIGNEQELHLDTMSSNIAARTMHELYLWPFADAVKANVTSVMCSYNKLNQTYACESGALLNALLKNELDFQGYVVSDWTAQHTTVGSANAGLDMSMPGDNFGDNNFLWGQNLLNAVTSGQVPQSRLDDMVRRILAAWYFVHQDQGYPATSFSSWNGGSDGPNVQGTHNVVTRAIARDGIVLLKNAAGALPLKKPASLALVGQDALVNPAGANACTDRGCDTGTLAMAWGSGTAQFPYLVVPYDAIKARAASDGTTLTLSNTDGTSAGAAAASPAAMAIVFVNADSGEGYITVKGVAGDRSNLDPWHGGDALVQAVAKVNRKTIVVAHSVGPLVVESWISNPNVVAVLWAGIPGQESGNGLADVLYGSVSASGKLPYTIAKAVGDYGTSIQTYTNFTYTNLQTTPPSNQIPSPGGPASLYAIVATVSATIKNSRSVAGAEVAQLYITLPASAPATPVRQLRGFKKLSLAPGASATVTFSLRRKYLSYWDVGGQRWVMPTGTFGVAVGASSRDLRLVGNL